MDANGAQNDPATQIIEPEWEIVDSDSAPTTVIFCHYLWILECYLFCCIIRMFSEQILPSIYCQLDGKSDKMQMVERIMLITLQEQPSGNVHQCKYLHYFSNWIIIVGQFFLNYLTNNQDKLN